MSQTFPEGSTALSVLMPVYNGERFLRAALESILSQTFGDFKLIVINDASTDSTLSILESIQDPRLEVHTNSSNLGLIASLNLGLKLCTAPLIARMDHDDLAMPERLAKQVAFMNAHSEVGVLGTQYQIIDESGALGTQVKHPLSHDEIICDFFFRGCVLAHPTVVFRRLLLDTLPSGSEVFDPNFKNAEDFDLWLRFAKKTRFQNLPEVLLHYRKHASQISQDQAKAQWEKSLELRARHFFTQLEWQPSQENKNYLLEILRGTFKRSLNFELSLRSFFKMAAQRNEELAGRGFNSELFSKKAQGFLNSRLISAGQRWGRTAAKVLFRRLNFALAYLKMWVRGGEKSIPVLINNFNRLDSTRRLVEWLRSQGFKKVYILDNASSYAPLLEWYASAPADVIHLGKNIGHLALWQSPGLFKKYRSDFYIYTDSDVLPVDTLPADWLRKFLSLLWSDAAIEKVGFSLRIDDLPESTLRESVIQHESAFWQEDYNSEFFEAPIDTTFALYRPRMQGGNELRGLRSKPPYLAQHLPWYVDPKKLNEEEKYYYSTAQTSTHWSQRISADLEKFK